MTMIEKNFVGIVAQRTFENLRIVCESEQSQFEVTQLLNSFIGLLAFPKKEHFKQWRNDGKLVFPNQRIEQIAREGKCDGDYYSMLRHLRNAVVHERLDLQSATQEIEMIRFQDEPLGGGQLDESGKPAHKYNFYLKVEDVYNILMGILYLEYQELHEEFPLPDVKKIADKFGWKLDVYGER